MENFKIEKLNLKATSLRLEWERFSQEFKCLSSINGIDKKEDAVKLNYFYLLVGSDAVKLIKLFGLTEENKKKFNVVFQSFENYCSPKSNILVERFRFFNRIQGEDESLEKYINDVRELATTCDFHDPDLMSRDKIIFGLKNEKLRDKIMFDGDEKISLDTLIGKIRMFSFQQEQMQNSAMSTNSKEFQMDEVQSSKKFKCWRCNKNHEAFKCPAFNKICQKCKRKGHLSSMCKNGKKVNALEEKEDEEASDEEVAFDIDSVRYVNTWFKELLIKGKIINFKLDTGAQINVINEKLLHTIDSNLRPSKTKIKLQAYFGDTFKPLGKIKLPVKFKGKIFDEEFIVIRGNNVPLLGLYSCLRLNLLKRLDNVEINKVVTCENEQDRFVDYYSSCFQGVGKFERPFRLQLKENFTPFACPSRRFPLFLKKKLENKLKEMEEEKIISRVNESREWINNIVVVEKADKIRVCIDPKHLNNALKKFHYPIPSLEEFKLEFKDAKFFTVLDLKNGFWHVELDEDSKKLCTFSTPFGLWQFERMPFGLCIASEVFQKYMFDTFGDLSGVKFYIDDAIITGKTLKEHDQNLRNFMLRAQEKGIKLNEKKVQFTKNSVKFFGHIFAKNSVKVDPDRILAIENLPIPENKNDIQKFLGVVNYIRDFIPRLPDLTHNIRSLLKKDSEFIWLANHQAEFDKLKEIIKTTVECSCYDENLPLELETDASGYGLGACLKQGNNVISYASRCLSDSEKEYGQIEKEFLAVYFGCKKFHNYIYGREVNVTSDHKPLESIMKKDLSKIGSTRLQRLRLKLFKYNLKLEFKPGTKIPIADYLSRYVTGFVEKNFEEKSLTEMIHCISVSDESLKIYQNATNNDETLKWLIKYYQDGWPSDKSKVNDLAKYYFQHRDEIYVSDGLVFYENRLIIPKELYSFVLDKVHEGHMGIVKTLKLAKESLFWPSMAQSIENRVNQCEICNKYQKSNKKEPIIQHSIPSKAFEKVGCDIAEFKGKWFLVLIDYYSKWICCKALSSKKSSNVISKWIEIFSEHGVPREIIADNMPFNSVECRSFAKDWDVIITTTSPNYPQSNGLAEKAVGIVKNMMKKSANPDHFHIALMNYNNTPLSHLDSSPSQLAQNRRMRTKIVISSKLLEPEIVKNVKEKIEKKNFETKFYYNRAVTSKPDFVDNQQVWVQKEDKTWLKGKIIEKLNAPRSYKILLENGSKLRRNSRFIRVNKGRPMIELPSNRINSNRAYNLDPETFFNDNTMHSSSSVNYTNNQLVQQSPSPLQTTQQQQQPSTPIQVLRRTSRISKPVQRYVAGMMNLISNS